MEGQFLIRQIYDDEITYNLIGAAVEILSKYSCFGFVHVSYCWFIFLVFVQKSVKCDILVKAVIVIIEVQFRLHDKSSRLLVSTEKPKSREIKPNTRHGNRKWCPQKWAHFIAYACRNVHNIYVIAAHSAATCFMAV